MSPAQLGVHADSGRLVAPAACGSVASLTRRRSLRSVVLRVTVGRQLKSTWLQLRRSRRLCTRRTRGFNTREWIHSSWVPAMDGHSEPEHDTTKRWDRSISRWASVKICQESRSGVVRQEQSGLQILFCRLFGFGRPF